MSDDLDPTAVERLATDILPAIRDARWAQAFGREAVIPTDAVLAETAARAALAAAGAGEAEPVLDGQCGNTMVVRCWAWCGLAPGHDGECEAGGVTGRVHGAPAESAQHGGEADVWTCGHCGRAGGAHAEGGPAVDCLYEPVLRHGGEAVDREALADLQRIADRLAESRFPTLFWIAAEMNEALLHLNARGDAPVRPAEPRPLSIDGTWLVERWDEHTCGAGPGSGAGHEPGCGTVPLVDLSTLPGWSSVRSVSATQVRALRERLADPAWRRETLPARVEGVLHALDLRRTP